MDDQQQQQIVDDALKLLVDVMHGELDGRPTSITERIRAAVYLYRWYIGGDLMPPEDGPEDELSAAIKAYEDEQRAARAARNKAAFDRQFWSDPPSATIVETYGDDRTDIPTHLPA